MHWKFHGSHVIIILFSFNIQYCTIRHTTGCLQVKYERMIQCSIAAGNYRGRFNRKAVTRAPYHVIYRQLRFKDLPKVPTWRREGFEPVTIADAVHRTSFLSIHSGHFYSAPSSLLLGYSEALPTTARILYRIFTPKRTVNCR